MFFGFCTGNSGAVLAQADRKYIVKPCGSIPGLICVETKLYFKNLEAYEAFSFRRISILRLQLLSLLETKLYKIAILFCEISRLPLFLVYLAECHLFGIPRLILLTSNTKTVSEKRVAFKISNIKSGNVANVSN
jgi:hypothetical protein